jgi:CPA2 family monovalent cation:H+ antiporter-2
MLFDPHILVNNLYIFWLSLRLLWSVKPCSYGIGAILPLSNQYSSDCRCSLAQIGEFSFILATLGVSLGLLTLEAQNLILAGALFSITLIHLYFSAIEPVQRWIRERSHLARLLERSGDPLQCCLMKLIKLIYVIRW